jgi:hypothetical protein
MKKLVFGCLGVLVVFTVAAAAGGYFFIYRPAKSYLASFAQLQEIPQLNEQIRNKAPFAPPAGGELTAEMVDRFMKAQQALQTRLGARVDELDAKYKTFSSEADASPAIRETLAVLRDLAGLVVDAKRAQVEALNQFNFSLEEYEWARGSIYEALGVSIDTTFEQAIRQAAAGNVPEFESGTGRMSRHVPERNRELVAPYADQLRDGVALVFFGL